MLFFRRGAIEQRAPHFMLSDFLILSAAAVDLENHLSGARAICERASPNLGTQLTSGVSLFLRTRTHFSFLPTVCHSHVTTKWCMFEQDENHVRNTYHQVI
jgi:hypothetical protein